MTRPSLPPRDPVNALAELGLLVREPHGAGAIRVVDQATGKLEATVATGWGGRHFAAWPGGRLMREEGHKTRSAALLRVCLSVGYVRDTGERATCPFHEYPWPTPAPRVRLLRLNEAQLQVLPGNLTRRRIGYRVYVDGVAVGSVWRWVKAGRWCRWRAAYGDEVITGCLETRRAFAVRSVVKRHLGQVGAS